ncbi:MAG: tetratricopeptide repeat protein [Bryobacteraceae bacterium]
MRPGILALFLAVCCSAQQAPNAEQLFHEAVAAQKRGDYAVAIQDYREVVKLRPDVLEARANLGAALAHVGRLDEAIAEYQAALAKAPQNPALRLNLGLAYYKKADWKDAADQFAAAYASAHGDVRIATLLGDCYSHLNRNADAIGVLAPLAAAQPQNMDVAWAYGSALIRAGRLKEGLALVDNVAREGNSAEAYLLAGNTELQMNEFEKARADADAASRLNPKLPGLATLRGRTLEYLGDDAGAVTALRDAIQANPDDFDAHLTLGAILNTQRDLPGARENLDKAVELNPTSALARFELARVERSQDELDKAAADFEAVTRTDPNWLQPHVELAALYFKMKRPADGRRERALVDKLTAEQEQHRSTPAGLTSQPPSQ